MIMRLGLPSTIIGLEHLKIVKHNLDNDLLC